MKDTLPLGGCLGECLWAKRRAEVGTSTSNFEQLNFIGQKCRTDLCAFLLWFCKSSSAFWFCEVMENKGLFVLGPVDYFLWNPSCFISPPPPPQFCALPPNCRKRVVLREPHIYWAGGVFTGSPARATVGLSTFLVWVAGNFPWPARNVHTTDFCWFFSSLLRQLISGSRATSVRCQMPLPNMTGEPDWKYNVLQWFPTDDFWCWC